MPFTNLSYFNLIDMAGHLLSAEEEVQVVKSLQNRDLNSFGKLYDIYAPALLGIIKRIVPNTELAEAALQNSFVQIWNYISEYSPTNGRLFTGLAKTARQTAFDIVKNTGEGNPGDDKNVHFKLKEEENAGSYAKNPERRNAFELIYFKGLSVDQAAGELQVAAADIKDHVRLSMQNLHSTSVL